MTLFEKLREIMASTLEISAKDISEDSTMDQIEEWDSLGHVHIMVALEQTFDLYMDAEDFAELDSVRAILRYLESENVTW
ncbi:MAG: acyl carrier protein [Halioglobus sp.]|nr:acyl carrier protein [Halioglobus sp.]